MKDRTSSGRSQYFVPLTRGGGYVTTACGETCRSPTEGTGARRPTRQLARLSGRLSATQDSEFRARSRSTYTHHTHTQTTEFTRGPHRRRHHSARLPAQEEQRMACLSSTRAHPPSCLPPDAPRPRRADGWRAPQAPRPVLALRPPARASPRLPLPR